MNTDDDDSDEDQDEFDDDPDRDPEGCCLGSACLNPHPYHLACECFDLEMAEADHAAQEGGAP